MPNIRKFDLEQAKQLRFDGMTFAEISQRLGCSVAWCAKELKGISKGEGKRDAAKVEIKEEVLKILQEATAKIRKL